MRSESTNTRIIWLSWGAIAGQLLFMGAWLVLGMIEGDGYDPGRHDVSDLGALTAHHALLWQAVLGVSGALGIAFAIWALRPVLALPDRRGPLGAWLVALSLPVLDNFSDTFFRLDCRAADAGCTSSAAASSWHGQAHLVAFGIAAIATFIAPFALAHRMRLLDRWRDVVRPARAFGVLFILGFVGVAATIGTDIQGWTQRGLIVFACSGLIALARRVEHVARSTVQEPVPTEVRS
jgi:hypothetical protein